MIFEDLKTSLYISEALLLGPVFFVGLFAFVLFGLVAVFFLFACLF